MGPEWIRTKHYKHWTRTSLLRPDICLCKLYTRGNHERRISLPLYIHIHIHMQFNAMQDTVVHRRRCRKPCRGGRLQQHTARAATRGETYTYAYLCTYGIILIRLVVTWIFVYIWHYTSMYSYGYMACSIGCGGGGEGGRAAVWAGAGQTAMIEGPFSLLETHHHLYRKRQ